MTRKEKIRALQAFAKGNPNPLRELLDDSGNPLFVSFVEKEGKYYLDHNDTVMTKDEFDNYTGGRQVVFALPYNFREGLFPNKHLPQ